VRGNDVSSVKCKKYNLKTIPKYAKKLLKMSAGKESNPEVMKNEIITFTDIG
jgi:hypothetical protein